MSGRNLVSLGNVHVCVDCVVTIPLDLAGHSIDGKPALYIHVAYILMLFRFSCSVPSLPT